MDSGNIICEIDVNCYNSHQISHCTKKIELINRLALYLLFGYLIT